jgi:hypothetical protein
MQLKTSPKPMPASVESPIFSEPALPLPELRKMLLTPQQYLFKAVDEMAYFML